MNWLEALILGIVQGLTEFLPVSSSGHIELGKALLGSISEENLAFTIIVHFGTVCSTLIIFRRDIGQIITGLFQRGWNEHHRFVINVLISMIPVLIVGLLWKDQVEALFDGRIVFVGCMLLITGLLLLATVWATKKDQPVKPRSAFLVGVAQAVAVLPGISRSGATIATGLMLGIDRARIARFSFLMVIPPILGITLLDIKDLAEADAAGTLSIHWSNLAIGFVCSFLTGLLACRWMIELVKRGKISYFAIYCFAVGLLAIILGWFN